MLKIIAVHEYVLYGTWGNSVVNQGKQCWRRLLMERRSFAGWAVIQPEKDQVPRSWPGIEFIKFIEESMRLKDLKLNDQERPILVRELSEYINEVTYYKFRFLCKILFFQAILNRPFLSALYYGVSSCPKHGIICFSNNFNINHSY
jgi:hypothetical protein